MLSCNSKPKIPDCECKFMLDLIVKQSDSLYSKNKDLFDPNLYNSCIIQYKNNFNDNSPRPELISVYKYYHNTCPSYDFEILE